MRARCRLTGPALLALAGMLFLQAAIAFAACELPDRSAAMAVAMGQGEMTGCHEADRDAGLCLGHCSSQDQTLGKAQLQPPDMTVPPAPVMRAAPAQASATVPQRSAYLAVAGPPARILFQSFLL